MPSIDRYAVMPSIDRYAVMPCIVRRKRRGQAADSRGSHTRIMSQRATSWIAGLAALGCAAGAFYWLHARGEQPVRATAPAEPLVARETSLAEKRALGVAAASRSKADAKKAASPAGAEPLVRAGEVLDYTANVSKLNNVANLRLQVAERRDFLGKSAWHLQAFAHTENPLRMVFELDDQFDSYSDAGTLTSLQYEMHLRERGQKVNSVQRMTATGKEPAPAHATAARVLPGTRDPLGMMQFLRNTDWTKTPEVRCPVYDGHKLYDVRAKLKGASASVTVPAGSYTAFKIDVRVFDNGVEMKDAYFSLYLANNAARTPVLLEAVMPFADARVELVKAK